MTELDKKKIALRRLLDSLSAVERKEVLETYGDDLIKWHKERLTSQEMSIKAREDKLRKMGVNINTIREKMGEYLAAKFGGEE